MLNVPRVGRVFLNESNKIVYALLGQEEHPTNSIWLCPTGIDNLWIDRTKADCYFEYLMNL
jgi:hypothetical protein